MSTSHTHDHDHSHEGFQPDIAEPSQDWEFLEIALRELLIDKGVFSAAELQAQVEAWEQKGPHHGAAVIARAWCDDAFRRRLLEDGNAALEEMGHPFEGLKLVVVENTPTLHHVVVCTLCSCYPRSLIGVPPLWYKSRDYRSRCVREPRAVLEEFGTELGPEVEIRVLDSTADCRYLVIPCRPPGTQGMSEEDLATLVTRDSMIGTRLATTPDA